MKPVSLIALSVCWIVLSLLRIGPTWGDLWWFLITFPRKDPRTLPEVDPGQVWIAGHSVWWLIALVFWSAVLFRTLMKMPRKPRGGRAEQAADMFPGGRNEHPASHGAARKP